MGRRGVQCTMLGTNHPRSGRECGARAVSARSSSSSAEAERPTDHLAWDEAAAGQRWRRAPRSPPLRRVLTPSHCSRTLPPPPLFLRRPRRSTACGARMLWRPRPCPTRRDFAQLVSSRTTLGSVAAGLSRAPFPLRLAGAWGTYIRVQLSVVYCRLRVAMSLHCVAVAERHDMVDAGCCVCT
jgi:hypothetical protein